MASELVSCVMNSIQLTANRPALVREPAYGGEMIPPAT